MNIVKLKNITEILSGYAFPSNKFTDNPSSIPLIRIRDIGTNKPTTFYTGEFDKKYLIKKGDLLIAMDGEFKIKRWYLDEALLNQRVCKIKSKNENVLLSEYLFYFLPKALKLIEDKTPFVTVKHLSVNDIFKIGIPLPSLEEQKRIVQMLDAADALREKRKEAIRLLDEYLKSVFLDMFGDPVKNTKNFKIIKFGEIIEDIRYGSSRKSISEPDNDLIPILRIPNIIKGSINYVDLQYQKLPINEKKKIILKKGDILFVRSNGNPDYIGRCAVFDDEKEYIFASYLIRVRLRQNVNFNPFFVRYCFSMDSYKYKIRKESRTTAGNYNINTKGIKNFDLICPNINEQENFLKIFRQIQILKQKMHEQAVELDNHFNSLLQKAFSNHV